MKRNSDRQASAAADRRASHQCQRVTGGLLPALLVLAAGFLTAQGVSATDAISADALTPLLTRFMRAQYTTPPVSLQVEILTPAARRLSCLAPQFSLPARNRVWGNLSVRMTCGGQSRYLQTRVQVTDRYLVAARPIAAGQTLTEQDVVWRTDRLDGMMVPPLSDLSLVIGSISERVIGSGQALNANGLRHPWLITNGQPVTVTALGAGFAIHGSGKALGNAASQGTLRIRMDSGQVLSGIATAAGQVQVR